MAQSMWVAAIGILIILSISGCSSPTAEPAPSPFAKVHFVTGRVDLEGTEWMEERAIEQGLEFNGIKAQNTDVALLFGGLSVGGGTLRSLLLRTADGGKNWVEVMDPDRASEVWQVTFVEEGRGWAMTLWTVEGPGAVSLYSTLDSGCTWTHLSEVPKWQWFGVPTRMRFLDGQTGQIDMMYDDDNRIAILTTRDGGLTWQETSYLALGTTDAASEEAEATYRAGLPNASESEGTDGSYWKLDVGDWSSESGGIVVSRRMRTEDEWSVVSVMPRNVRYVDGRALLD